ncbi:Acyl carrier protein like [Actinidia chinensis var. chinensis]|uniref:Acyl carrier protein n=1 Tax=Actinidia chinensis var. chinensis TaxID=1590841 RepID=A0A2R6PUR8_ACTCC|nr:Acyl carrier protein like [Actinidia chinensis var. chinensis]
MASFSATSSLSFFSVRANNPQVSGRNSCLKVVSMVSARNSFTSLRTARFHVSCSARPETVEQVCEVVRKQLVLPAERPLLPNTKFSELGADSLDTVEIVMGLEEKFDIEVAEESAENITTVQEAADLIEKLILKKGA